MGLVTLSEFHPTAALLPIEERGGKGRCCYIVRNIDSSYGALLNRPNGGCAPAVDSEKST